MRILKLPKHGISLKYLLVNIVLTGGFMQINPAYAIPSPELIIGSVSSLSQIFAVGFAVVSGAVAAFGAKFGLKKKTGAVQSAFLLNTLIVLVLLLSASVGYIFYQNNQSELAEQLRLRNTLIRPAQFSGTKILDDKLKETSLSDQKASHLGISTVDAEGILKATDNTKETLFLDVREDAEFQMGTLLGARHIRFPDIAKSGLDLKHKRVILVCHNGNRSSETCARLAAMGIDCSFIAGGLEKWIVEGRGFTDSTVRGLSDLRAIPDYKNKEVLISTARFETMVAQEDIQIVDTRYPKDFAMNHLPNAINIPLRALPTEELNKALSRLKNKPTMVACYDRRSCFMGQVLGLEITNRGIDYKGRYTTPWDYFIAAPLKPHIQNWLADKDETLWHQAIDILSGWLLMISEKSHLLLGVLALSLFSRVLILPIALKSEKDQIVLAAHKIELDRLKQKLKEDPKRRARAVGEYHKRLGLTPLRNLSALLFLPVMMLGLSAVEQAAPAAGAGFLWVLTLENPDPLFLLPLLFCILSGTYLQMTLANTFKRSMFCWGLIVPLLFALVFQLTAAGVIYLCISLALLLTQRAYVTGIFRSFRNNLVRLWQQWHVKYSLGGIIPLHYSSNLKTCGNKSYRLSVLENAGFNVPQGIVITNNTLMHYLDMPKAQRAKFFDRLWHMIGRTKCVIRSSGSDEDGQRHSFAGVFDSVLDVTRENLYEAFEHVLASFQSNRSDCYQGRKAVVHRANILIQQMIEAQYSGVLFTQDPMAPGQMMLEIAKGTADDLVSGRVTPISLRFGKYTHQSCDGLNAPIDILSLLEIGRKVEDLFKHPQDIEWAYRGGVFFIVQSRDITTLNTGSVIEKERQKEWSELFDVFGASTIKGPILKQDEMSEVLPRPTPLSFSIMTSLWVPGGSVDQACRALGLKYNMPEGGNGHLYQLFGKVYADVAVKSKVALHLPKSVECKLENYSERAEIDFHQKLLPALHKELAYWGAIDFEKLNLDHQLECIGKLTRYFVNEVYVIAEKVNILTSFLNLKAEAECRDLALDILQLMQAAVPHSPSHIIAQAMTKEVSKRKEYLIQTMGHRALFDYELAMPRYAEAPEALWKLAKNSAQPLHLDINKQAGDKKNIIPDIVKLALRFQDVKEQAKHESLHIFVILRRVLLLIDVKFGSHGYVFYLNLDELLSLTENNFEFLRKRASVRFENAQSSKKMAPKAAALSLHECEKYSNPAHLIAPQVGGICGTYVSCGQNITGTVYIAPDCDGFDTTELKGFVKGDIFVCEMMNPAWLPYVLQSKAVLCAVGGWLSHMAIVARENDIPMLVGCVGLDGLENRMEIKILKSGKIEFYRYESKPVKRRIEIG